MKRTLRTLYALLRIRFSGLMAYRLSFFTALIADGTLFIVQLVFFRLLTRSAVQGWSPEMYTMFVGSFLTLDGAYMATWFFGVIDLPRLIRTGELDLYRVRPLDTLVYLSFSRMDGGSAPLVLLGMAMALSGAAQAGCLTLPNVLLWLLALAVMYVLMYALSLLVREAAFWMTNTNALVSLEEQLVSCSFRLPLPAITGAWKYILLLALPYGLAANFPACALAGQTSPLWWLYAAGLTAAFLAFALLLWRAGLRRYESASS